MAADADHVSDDELLGRIASGDVDALAELFRRRQQGIYRFVLHLTGSSALADDVTQDVFVTVIREAGRFEPGRSVVPAWLCGIARNSVRRRLALEKGVASLDGDHDRELDLPVVTPDPLGDLTSAERIESLRRAVLTLPLRYREAIVLCDLQEMSYADAAAAMNCPVGTVRSRLNRGRTMLAARMQAEQRAADRSGERQPRITRALA
jgi:RNA polymerase sigma-70 factor (ECF subfamily)